MYVYVYFTFPTYIITKMLVMIISIKNLVKEVGRDRVKSILIT